MPKSHLQADPVHIPSLLELVMEVKHQYYWTFGYCRVLFRTLFQRPLQSVLEIFGGRLHLGKVCYCSKRCRDHSDFNAIHCHCVWVARV